MTDPTGPAPPRWPPYVSVVGVVLAIGGVLMATGQWRQKTEDLDRRVTKVEDRISADQLMVYEMKADVRFLAERARREDGTGRGESR